MRKLLLNHVYQSVFLGGSVWLGNLPVQNKAKWDASPEPPEKEPRSEREAEAPQCFMSFLSPSLLIWCLCVVFPGLLNDSPISVFVICFHLFMFNRCSHDFSQFVLNHVCKFSVWGLQEKQNKKQKGPEKETHVSLSQLFFF